MYKYVTQYYKHSIVYNTVSNSGTMHERFFLAYSLSDHRSANIIFIVMSPQN